MRPRLSLAWPLMFTTTRPLTFKVLSAQALALCLAFTMASCGGGDSDAQADRSRSSGQPAQAASSDSAVVDNAEPALGSEGEDVAAEGESGDVAGGPSEESVGAFAEKLSQLGLDGDIDGLCDMTDGRAIEEFNQTMLEVGRPGVYTCEDFWTLMIENTSMSDWSGTSSRIEIDGDVARVWGDDGEENPTVLAWTADGWKYSA